MLDRRLRAGVERGLAPLGDRLARLGVTADVITAFGLACAVVTGVLVAVGHPAWAVVGIVCAGIGDLLDGTIARRSGRAGPRGSFFDSVADRVADAVMLGGVAWYLAGDGGHGAVLAFAVAACSMLISYERAKAEALGYEARGGVMERAERLVLLGVGLAFADPLLVPVLWVMAVLSAFTVIQRFVRVWRQASVPVEPRVHTPRRRRRERVETPATPLRTWWEQRRPRVERTRQRHPSGRRPRR